MREILCRIDDIILTWEMGVCVVCIPNTFERSRVHLLISEQ